MRSTTDWFERGRTSGSSFVWRMDLARSTSWVYPNTFVGWFATNVRIPLMRSEMLLSLDTGGDSISVAFPTDRSLLCQCLDYNLGMIRAAQSRMSITTLTVPPLAVSPLDCALALGLKVWLQKIWELTFPIVHLQPSHYLGLKRKI